MEVKFFAFHEEYYHQVCGKMSQPTIRTACRGNIMSDQDPGDSGPVPMMQKLLDNPFLLLFIGVASPAVLYLVWGIMEIVTIPAR
jgi:hypothetical protein